MEVRVLSFPLRQTRAHESEVDRLGIAAELGGSTGTVNGSSGWRSMEISWLSGNCCWLTDFAADLGFPETLVTSLPTIDAGIMLPLNFVLWRWYDSSSIVC